MGSNKPKKDCWDVDINKIKNNDQREIELLYEKTKRYFLWFFQGDEELFNDFILRVINKINQFSGGQFHNWLWSVAMTIKINNKLDGQEIFNKNLISIDGCYLDIAYEPEELVFENKMYRNRLKLDLKRRVELLDDEDQEFVNGYFKNTVAHSPAEKMRWSRLKEKMKKL